MDVEDSDKTDSTKNIELNAKESENVSQNKEKSGDCAVNDTNETQDICKETEPVVEETIAKDLPNLPAEAVVDLDEMLNTSAPVTDINQQLDDKVDNEIKQPVVEETNMADLPISSLDAATDLDVIPSTILETSTVINEQAEEKIEEETNITDLPKVPLQAEIIDLDATFGSITDVTANQEIDEKIDSESPQIDPVLDETTIINLPKSPSDADAILSIDLEPPTDINKEIDDKSEISDSPPITFDDIKLVEPDVEMEIDNPVIINNDDAKLEAETSLVNKEIASNIDDSNAQNESENKTTDTTDTTSGPIVIDLDDVDMLNGMWFSIIFYKVIN